MKLSLKYFFIVLIGLGINACSTIKDPKLVSLENVDVNSVGNSFSILTDLNIYNPNNFSLYSKNVNVELFLDDLFVGKINLLNQFKVKRKDTLKLRSKLNLDPMLFDQKVSLDDTLNLNLRGSAKISFIPLNYKFNIQQKLMLSDLIEPLVENNLKDSNINFKSIHIKNIGLSRVDMISVLTFKNNFNFDYSIEKLNVEIYDSSRYNNIIGESNIENPIEVKNNNEFEIESAITLNTAKLGKSILKNLLKKRYTLFVKVNVIINFNQIKLPFSIFKELDYNPITQEIYIKNE